MPSSQLPSDLPDAERDFVREHAPSYQYNCPCDDCDYFRNLLDIEFDVEVDLEEEFGLDSDFAVGNFEGFDDPPTCDVCNDRPALFEMREDDEDVTGFSCESCWSDPIIHCPECGEFTHGNRDWSWYSGENSGEDCYCQSCVDEGRIPSQECDHCEEVFIGQEDGDFESTTFYDIVCNDCITRHFNECADCGDVVSSHSTMAQFVDEIHFACEACIETEYEVCNDCGEIQGNHSRNACGCPDDGIWRYSYVPPTLKHHTASDQLTPRKKKEDKPYASSLGRLYFGIENEIEDDGYHRAEAALDISDYSFLYCKRDSTLESGFEIVSHPFTFRWLQENKNKFKSMFGLFDDYYTDFRSDHTRTTGMHVHLSKDAFSRIHLLKFMRLVYENPDLTLAISQRGSTSSLNEFSSINGDASCNLTSKARRKQGNGSAGRYVAVNLGNSQTVEVRIFRGTLNYETFMKNVEYCHAAFEFSRTHSVQDMTKKDFVNWLVDLKHKKYSNLEEFLASKGIL